MYRIKDYYNWKRLRQWNYVVGQGSVGWKEAATGHVEDNILENALRLLINDCFPTAIVCRCTQDNQKEILATPLWEDIFSFINDKRQIIRNGKCTSFQNMKPEEQNAILNASIFSIWIKD